MSASNLSSGQFGSVTAGTYDVEANRQWNQDHFRPVRLKQWEQIKAVPQKTLQQAAAARAAGDRVNAARLLTQAAGDRRMASGWTHLKR